MSFQNFRFLTNATETKVYDKVKHNHVISIGFVSLYRKVLFLFRLHSRNNIGIHYSKLFRYELFRIEKSAYLQGVFCVKVQV